MFHSEEINIIRLNPIRSQFPVLSDIITIATLNKLYQKIRTYKRAITVTITITITTLLLRPSMPHSPSPLSLSLSNHTLNVKQCPRLSLFHILSQSWSCAFSFVIYINDVLRWWCGSFPISETTANVECAKRILYASNLVKIAFEYAHLHWVNSCKWKITR